MNSEKESKRLKVLLLIAGLMLCFAVIPMMPYGYYTLLRLIVCGVAVYAAIRLKDQDALDAHFIPLVVLAVLFNPLIPIFLPQALWLFIDLGVAVYFLTLSKKI